MLNISRVSACLVSREPIPACVLESLTGFGEIIVGDGTHGVIARYEAVRMAKFDVVYSQDDDCLVNLDRLISGWDGRFVSYFNTAQNRRYPRGPEYLGYGSFFKKSLVRTLDLYTTKWGVDDLLRRECDRVFTRMNRVKSV